jgi:3-deoxy-D-manno-octulosonic-acid transferase
MFRVAIFFYSILYTVALLLYGPVRLLMAAFRSQKLAVLERIGRVLNLPSRVPDRPAVWIHAVSVGEVNAARGLINTLSDQDLELYLSTTTQTGQEQAKNLFHEKAHIFYFPLDWKFLCKRYLKHIYPGAVLLMETEIWPNFLISAQMLKIPVVLVNGRISDQSFKRYIRFRFILQPLLACFSHFCMQSDQDLKRIQRMGAPGKRTTCTGNLKFDYNLSSSPELDSLKQSIGRILKSSSEDFLLICGSTKPGEEEILLSIFEDLCEEFPNLKLMLAPRHPHRGDEVVSLARAKGFECLQRSRDPLAQNGATTQVFVLDSIGELASLYELGDLVFIGGSLVPEGGQNVIEAAAYGKPILFGPHMENFRQVAKSFVDAGAARQLPDSNHLKIELRTLIQDPEKRIELGQKARGVIESHRGAVRRTVEAIGPYLPLRITRR